jgi:deoxyribonuclease V
MAAMWPTDEAALLRAQTAIAAADPPPWVAPPRPVVGGCWVCFPRGLSGPGAAYVPGLLALRIGPLLEQAVLALPSAPDVLLLDATGADHPRRAGLALHLGAELGAPTIGVTHRPLLGRGEWPADERGATAPLRVGGTTVGCWVRTQPEVRPLVVHPGWRVDMDTAVGLVLAGTRQRRTPEPLRRARHRARLARAAGG